MREALLGVAVGKKGIGKTYITMQLLQSYVKGGLSTKPRRALVMDVNDEYENIQAIKPSDVALFSHHPKVEARRIRPYNEDGSKMTLDDVADCLWQVLQDYRGGMLLIEDINKYVSDFLPQDLIGSLCTNRHSNLDIILHFQSIGRVGTKIWQNINFLRFHKNTDSVDRHKKKFEDKYEAFKICEILINKQYFAGNIYFYLTYNCDSEKIMGNYSKEMISEAIDEYIALNYSQKVKPLMNMKNAKGKAKYNSQTATKYLKQQLSKSYIGNA